MLARAKRRNSEFLNTNDAEILKGAASLVSNPSDAASLCDGRFCFICGKYFATKFCEMTLASTDEIIEKYAWDSTIAKRNRNKQKKFEFSGNIYGACCCCCRCYSCNLRVSKYRKHIEIDHCGDAVISKLIPSNSKFTPLEYQIDDQMLNDPIIVNEDIELFNEDSYLVRIAGNTSGSNYRNRRVKVDLFIPEKFISVCVPAAVKKNNKIIKTKWPSIDNVSREFITASDEVFHSVLIKLC
jgi:hypothetical protein